MNVIFRMGHESEHVALRVANASDVENGTVRVDGVIAVGGRAVCVDVGEGDLVIFNERRKRKEFGGLEVAFTMGNGTEDGVFQTFCPNVGLRNGSKIYPATFIVTLFVECECRTFFFLSTFNFLQRESHNRSDTPQATPP